MPRIAGHINAPPTPMAPRDRSSIQIFGRQSADQREEREDRRAEKEDLAPSEHVSEPAAGDDQDAENQGIAIDDPLHRGDVGAELDFHGGECDRERGEVVGDHQDGQAPWR